MSTNIFTRWSSFSIEELKKLADPGALIELARRTKRKEDRYKALTNLDMDTYNAIMVLDLIEDEELDDFLLEYDKILIPLLITGRNLSVEGNEEIYRWFANRVVKHSIGFLNEIAMYFSQLEKKVVTCNSKCFKTLVSLHYSPCEIAWLNYKLFSRYTGANNKCKLLVNALRAYLDSEVPVGQKIQQMLEKALTECPLGDDPTLYADCKLIDNTANWLFIKDMVDKNLVGEHCPFFLVNPSISLDLDKFYLMSVEQQFSCIDDCILQYKNSNDVQEFLHKIGRSDYLESLSRDIPNEVLLHLINVGLLEDRKITESRIIKIIGNVSTREAYTCFMQYEFTTGKVIDNFLPFSWDKSLNIQRQFLTVSENIMMADKLFRIIYEHRPDIFKDVVMKSLSKESFVVVYGTEFCQKLYEVYVELWGDNLNHFEKLRIWERIYSEDKVASLKSEYEEQQELQREMQLEKRIAEVHASMLQDLDNVKSYEDIANLLDEYRYIPNACYDALYEGVLDALKRLKASEPFNANAIDLSHFLLKHEKLSVEEFIKLVSEEVA